jgi:hypothetical protein
MYVLLNLYKEDEDSRRLRQKRQTCRQEAEEEAHAQGVTDVEEVDKMIEAFCKECDETLEQQEERLLGKPTKLMAFREDLILTLEPSPKGNTIVQIEMQPEPYLCADSFEQVVSSLQNKSMIINAEAQNHRPTD